MLSPENSSTGRLRRHFTNAIRNVKGASASLERTEVKEVLDSGSKCKGVPKSSVTKINNILMIFKY